MLKEDSRIIFLDIDGVLQPYSSQIRFEHDLPKTIEMLCQKYNDEIYKTIDKYDVAAAYYDWDLGAVKLLKECLDETKSIIVVSSSWRNFLNLKQLKAIFRFYDLDEYVKDSLPHGVDKKVLIKAYLKKNKSKILGYAVVDDDMFMTEFKPHMVETTNKLNEEDKIAIKKAINEPV